MHSTYEPHPYWKFINTALRMQLCNWNTWWNNGIAQVVCLLGTHMHDLYAVIWQCIGKGFNEPFKPNSTLLITSYCTGKTCRLCIRRKGGKGGGGCMGSPAGCCTHGSCLKGPWLTVGGPIHALATWAGLENTTLTFLGGFISGREGFLGSKRVFANKSADYCMLINEWASLRSRVSLY